MDAFAEVGLLLPRVQGTFHYSVPPDLASVVGPGTLVVAPFGPRRAQGIVLRRTGESPVAQTRPLESAVDVEPALNPGQLALAAWLHQSTRAPLGECLELMVPPGLARQADQLYTLAPAQPEPTSATETRLTALLRARGPLRGRQIDHHLPQVEWRRAAQRLLRAGALVSTPVLEPPRATARTVRSASLARPAPAVSQALDDLGRGAAAARRRRVLEALLTEGAPLDVTWLYAEAGARPEDLRFLRDRGLVVLGTHDITRDPLAQVAIAATPPPRLTRDQQSAWERIRQGLHGSGGAFLLHGVTGSGKTEIYLKAVDEVLAGGGSAIVLVPEIALTPQTTDRFLARFAGRVGVMHSALSPGERFDTWRRARAGELAVIIGARSALFAPLPRLRLIVVDEEHDESFKEREASVPYHAREAALAYARLQRAVCLLGSATPDLATYSRAQARDMVLLELPHRLPSGVPSSPRAAEPPPIPLPPVHVVDMRQELKAGNTSLFSRRLAQALTATLERGQQAILFLNRRGSSTYVFCRECGWVARCPRCGTPLTHHPAAEALRCHQCGYRRRPPTICPVCRGTRVRYFGAGTQRVQAELEARFPTVRALRWDWDSTRHKGAHAVILAHFASHRADVLIGTQMLAKGLDLPLVTLVGVVSADTGLFLPDYRAAERTFQILTQVAGRAGRGPAGGQVIFQTYHPEQEAIRAAAAHDYAAFFRAEITHRRELGYPPFRRLARLILRGRSAERVETEATRLAGRLRRDISRREQAVEVLGPTPCFFTRQRGLLRWQILLRGADPTPALPDALPEGWTVDIDPVSLL